MAKDSAIEWTHHTFNPWWGCTKITEACDNCYAATFSHRLNLDIWGTSAPRRFFGDAHWREPVAWNRQAEAQGERRRVFCASMADVFEDRRDLDELRARLGELITATPHLDWLLLTKRPQKAVKLAPWRSAWPDNVWAGTTVEHQRLAKSRIEALLKVPARTRFLSCEPLFSALDLSPWLDRLDWVIAGGESGGRARPSQVEWFRSLRDQCTSAGVSFHFKQWGNWVPAAETGQMKRVDKKAAGRVLDGRTWDEYPAGAAR